MISVLAFLEPRDAYRVLAEVDYISNQTILGLSRPDGAQSEVGPSDNPGVSKRHRKVN